MIQEDREAAEWFNKGIQQVLEMPELYGLEKNERNTAQNYRQGIT